MANKPNAPIKYWALLAYIAGDLSDAGLKDIREMCKEGSSQNTHVGVQIDTRGEHTGAMRYEISMPDWSGKAHRLVIDRIPEPDTGDPEVLKSFLEWGFGGKLNVAPSPKAMATAIVDSYISSYKKNGMDDVTQSAIDTAKTD